MSSQLKTSVINCPQRKREVEVTYKNTGAWYAPETNIVSCPAIKDEGKSCRRSCVNLLGHSPNAIQFLTDAVCRRGVH